MCLALLAINQHSQYPIIILSNRDEYYHRPSLAAGYWPEHKALYAGRDLIAVGTWLDVTRTGKYAFVTNYRDARTAKRIMLSRGALVKDYLISDIGPGDFLTQLQISTQDYPGFNLILGTRDGAYYFSNISNQIKVLSSGIYGVSNHLLDTPWPKVSQAKMVLTKLLTQNPVASESTLQTQLFQLLANRQRYADDVLPDTGIAIEKERILSAAFIADKMMNYGTCSSTVVLFGVEKNIIFAEKKYTSTNSKALLKSHTIKLML